MTFERECYVYVVLPNTTNFVTAAEQILEQIIIVIKNEWDNCLRRAGVTHKDYQTLAPACVYDGFYY